MISCSFQSEPIDPSKLIDDIADDGDGALLVFVGRARNRTGDKEVSCLDYEIYSGMAKKETDSIINEAVEKWGITSCIVVQRYGRVEIGEASIFIAVSSPHRDQSYQASRFIIDSIKKSVPVWKKENYPDGSCWISDRA